MNRHHDTLRSSRHPSSALRTLVAALACAGLAAACGGDGPPELAITGTAASGAALANASVDIKCATGSASATTAADGSYSVSIVDGVLPCVARASKDGVVLHGVSTASGSSARINLTPLTELVVAQHALDAPATYYSSYDATAAGALSASAVATAQTAVAAKLKAGGVDVGAMADASGGPLVARNGSTAGDGYDQALDRLQAALATGGTTLSAWTKAYVAEAAFSAGKTAGSGTASLPTELRLQPAAAGCGALRSGTYSVIGPFPSATLADQAGEMVVDAAALTARFDDGSTSTLTATTGCAYTADAGTSQVVVAQSGLIVWRYADGGSNHVAIAVPKQSHTLAELAGDWNSIGLERDGSTYTGTAGSVHLAADGTATQTLACGNSSTWSIKTDDCNTPSGSAGNAGVLRVNAAGGFDGAETAGGTADTRVFAFRAGNGELMLMHVGGDGSFGFHTRPRTLTLPTAGTASASWNLTVNQNLLAPAALSASANTITSVDAAAGSYLRQAGTVGQSTTRPETIAVNSPRNGYSTRQPGAAVNSAGATENVSQWTVLTMRGMGFSPLILPASKSFLLSVTQP